MKVFIRMSHIMIVMANLYSTAAAQPLRDDTYMGTVMNTDQAAMATPTAHAGVYVWMTVIIILGGLIFWVRKYRERTENSNDEDKD